MCINLTCFFKKNPQRKTTFTAFLNATHSFPNIDICYGAVTKTAKPLIRLVFEVNDS